MLQIILLLFFCYNRNKNYNRNDCNYNAVSYIYVRYMTPHHTYICVMCTVCECVIAAAGTSSTTYEAVWIIYR